MQPHRNASNSHGAHCGTDCAWNVCPYFIPSRTPLADLPARHNPVIYDLFCKRYFLFNVCTKLFALGDSWRLRVPALWELEVETET